MSKTVAVYHIISALSQGLVTGGALTAFAPVNHEQERYLERFAEWKGQLSKLTPEELETIASFETAGQGPMQALQESDGGFPELRNCWKDYSNAGEEHTESELMAPRGRLEVI